jgi:hypothetical protein
MIPIQKPVPFPLPSHLSDNAQLLRQKQSRQRRKHHSFPVMRWRLVMKVRHFR